MMLGLSIGLGARAGGGAAATPATIFGSALKRWYLENYTAATGVYVDETGNANTTAPGGKPGASTINGHPCMICDNTQTQYLVCGGDVEIITTAATLFAVVSASALGSTRLIWSKYYAGTAYGLGCHTSEAFKFIGFTNAAANGAVSNATHNDGATYALVMTYDAAATPTTKLYINGVLQTDTGTDAAGITNTADVIALGGGSNGAAVTSGWIGKIGNAGIANVAASEAEAAALSTYLMTWGGLV